jgi:nitroimidazol reductase NimA-like FMN-containing flavoprotein (pyridoxamine 5'-phosphate oxidase superfamily)
MQTVQTRGEPTLRTEVRRRPERSEYRREVIEAILDEGLVAHVGFAVDGQPYVMPMTYARSGDRLYLHGSPASRLLRGLRRGLPVCVTVTLLDGLVLARSAFHHSMNYRSVVILGQAVEVRSREEKRTALAAVVEHVVPGRTAATRPPSDREVDGTLVLALPLDEASAKIRSGPPVDEEADYSLAVWAGEIPVRLQAAEPVPDSCLLPGAGTVPTPAYRHRLTSGRRPQPVLVLPRSEVTWFVDSCGASSGRL